MVNARRDHGVLLATFLFLSTARMAAADPFLVNPGFESGDFSGWTVSLPGVPPNAYGVGTDGQLIPGIAFFGATFVTVRTGNFAAYMDGAAFLDQSLLLSQTLMLQPGRYFVGFFLGSDTPSQTGFGSSASIFLNGASLRLSAPQCIGNICGSDGIIPADASFHRFSASFFTNTGGPFTLGFLVKGSGTGAAGISVDDAFLSHTPVPEPATLLLLGAGVLGAGARHFRRARRGPASRS